MRRERGLNEGRIMGRMMGRLRGKMGPREESGEE